MDRVLTLTNKLQEQLSQNASVDQLLITVQMLQSELLHKKQLQPKKESNSAVSVHISTIIKERGEENEADAVPLEKTVEVLQVDEAELEAELEEIKRNAQAKNSMGAQYKPVSPVEPLEETPTPAPKPEAPAMPAKPALSRPAEIHEMISGEQAASLNEKLKQTKTELGDSLVDTPIKDLKKGIGVNDRFLFINELFRGDEVMYERSIKTINSFSIFPEAEYWMKRELKLKLGWNDKNEIVKQFDQIVKRRFS
jgi:hypothetical protein